MNKTMMGNYFKIAWRNLVKHKIYSGIKIGGFAFSIAACILIGLYIIHKTSFDQSYLNQEQLFRTVGRFNHDEGNVVKGLSFEAPMPAALLTVSWQAIRAALANPVKSLGQSEPTANLADHRELNK